MLLRYLAHLTTGRLILWCYFVWYVVVLVQYFDATPGIWLTSIGLSGIIGLALYISTTSSSKGTTRLEGWQIFRLFLMPFCVSSFAALVKGKGFILIFSPAWQENVVALGICGAFCLLVWILKRGANTQRA